VETDGFPAQLLRAEWSGSQQVLWLQSAAGLLRMLWPTAPGPPSSLRLQWHPNDALAFDERSGERLLQSVPAWSRDLIRSLQ
jgi:hypothetical protein